MKAIHTEVGIAARALKVWEVFAAIDQWPA
jgi:hypothetical protein